MKYVVWNDIFRGEHSVIEGDAVAVIQHGERYIKLNKQMYHSAFCFIYDEAKVNEIIRIAKELKRATDEAHSKVYTVLHSCKKA